MEIKKKENNDLVEKFLNWLRPNKPKLEISASEAYLQARYNKVESKEERYNKLLKMTNQLIMECCQTNRYYCTVEMEKELLDEFMGQFLKYFSDKGYAIVDMRKVIPNLENGYIFISWANFQNKEIVKNEDKSVVQ